jgi:hypothetical protein
MTANTGVNIWAAERVDPTEKYEDDMSNFRYPIPSHTPAPYSYAFDRTEALRHIVCLRILWRPIKFHNYTFIFTFLGFLWNLTNCTVTLPEAKRKNIPRTHTAVPEIFQAAALLDDRHHEAPQLAMPHHVRLPGRVNLPPLVVQFVVSFGDNPYMERYPTSDVMRNLEWWEKALSGPGVVHQLFPLGPRIDRHFYLNASTA